MHSRACFVPNTLGQTLHTHQREGVRGGCRARLVCWAWLKTTTTLRAAHRKRSSIVFSEESSGIVYCTADGGECALRWHPAAADINKVRMYTPCSPQNIDFRAISIGHELSRGSSYTLKNAHYYRGTSSALRNKFTGTNPQPTDARQPQITNFQD